jgi:chromosome segregation ATPase
MGNQRIITQLDGLATLRDLIEIIKNPSLIEAAQKALRDEASLTEEVLGKYDDAKILIAKAEELDIQFKAREQALDLKERKYSEKSKALEDKIQETTSQLENLRKELHKQEIGLADREKKLSVDKEVFAAEKSEFQNIIEEAKQEIDLSIAEVEKDKEANAKKENELAEYERIFKAKAAAIVEQASNIM